MTTSKDAFVAWAKAQAIPIDAQADLDDFGDLEPLKAVIGDARIVTFGESHHYTREYNRFRSRLFRFLVAEMGFRVFVLEVGFVEAKAATDYVNLVHDDADLAFSNVNQTFGLWAQQQEMLDWMRAYNVARADRPPEERLRFYGMDGTQGWQHCGTAVAAVCRYLDEVDPDYAARLRAELLPLARSVTVTALEAGIEADLQALTYGVTALVGRFECELKAYVERSSPEAFEWAKEFAVMAQQIVTMMTQVLANPAPKLRAWSNVRDYNMARQFKWAVDREGPDARILCGAHNAHLQTCDLLETEIPSTAMGQYYRAMAPSVSVVNIAGTANYSLKPDDPSAADSNQGALAEVGLESFLLDLRPAKGAAEAHRWLSEVRPERLNVNYQPLALAEAYDAVYYTERLSVDELRLPASLQAERITLDRARLEALTGMYVFRGFGDEREELIILHEDGRLFSDVGAFSGELFPMYKTELYAISEREFRWREWPQELTFDLDADGVAQGLTMTVANMDWSFRGEKL